jgi:hypothetical protein
MQSLCFAKGAIATWVFSFTIRHFQESGNRNLVGALGFEPRRPKDNEFTVRPRYRYGTKHPI